VAGSVTRLRRPDDRARVLLQHARERAPLERERRPGRTMARPRRARAGFLFHFFIQFHERNVERARELLPSVDLPAPRRPMSAMRAARGARASSRTR